MLKVCVITATKGRHECIERSVAYFLEQDYPNAIQIIHNNSCVEQKLAEGLDGKIILINNCISLQTGKPYESLGEIYNDTIKYIPEDVDVINFFDDDDVFLPNHISEGVKGLLRGNRTAYKPKFSFYKTKNATFKINNILEPSIFVKKEHILKYGFSHSSTPQHFQWLQPLIDAGEIFEDKNGKSTLIYDWSQNIPVFKTSGRPNNPDNFKNYEEYSKDEGDGIITPKK